MHAVQFFFRNMCEETLENKRRTTCLGILILRRGEFARREIFLRDLWFRARVCVCGGDSKLAAEKPV